MQPYSQTSLLPSFDTMNVNITTCGPNFKLELHYRWVCAQSFPRIVRNWSSLDWSILGNVRPIGSIHPLFFDLRISKGIQSNPWQSKCKIFCHSKDLNPRHTWYIQHHRPLNHWAMTSIAFYIDIGSLVFTQPILNSNFLVYHLHKNWCISPFNTWIG